MIDQIERLYARFTSLDKQNHGYLTREDFLRYDLVSAGWKYNVSRKRNC